MVTLPFYNTSADYPNATGAYKVLYAVRDSIVVNPFFIILMGFFLVAMTGAYYSEITIIGKSRFFNAFLASSLSTFVISVFFALGALVTPLVPVLFIALTVLALALVIFYR